MDRSEYFYWVRLPLDADGTPINIGDVMANHDGYDKEPFTVGCMTLYDGKWTVLGFSPDSLHHYNPPTPTVEDVLREFAEKITDSQIPNVHPTYEEAIAEYAAKLRLVDDLEKGGD